jgi:hypothetical protein
MDIRRAIDKHIALLNSESKCVEDVMEALQRWGLTLQCNHSRIFDRSEDKQWSMSFDLVDDKGIRVMVIENRPIWGLRIHIYVPDRYIVDFNELGKASLYSGFDGATTPTELKNVDLFDILAYVFADGDKGSKKTQVREFVSWL